MSQTLITATDQIKRLAEDAVESVITTTGLTEERIQRLIENRAEFQFRISEAIRALSENNQFVDEEVSSDYTYPPEYKGPRPIEEQIATLAKIFNLHPENALEYAESLPELPEGAEGWFAWPDYVELGRQYFHLEKNPKVLYCLGVNLVLEKIGESRRFYNCRKNAIMASRLRLHSRTGDAENEMRQIQKGPILIGAAQLGMRHRGRSVRKARGFFIPNEFGLGTLTIGSIALTHPERFGCYKELDVYCAGDEFDFLGDGRFFGVPCVVYCIAGDVRLDANDIGDTRSFYGTASAFQ